MGNFLLKRILWGIPTLILVSIFIFFLSKSVDQNSVNAQLELRGVTKESSANFQAEYEREYIRQNKNLPDFYFSISPDNYPPHLNGFSNENTRHHLVRLLKEGLSFENAQTYIEFISDNVPDSLIVKHQLYNATIDRSIFTQLPISGSDQKLLSSLISEKNNWHLPVFRWHGLKNQYHLWFSQFFTGDWGISYLDGQSVFSKVASAFKWTFVMMLINLFLLIIVGIPIVLLAVFKGGFSGKIVEFVMLIFYVIPLFWLASLIQVFFASPEYGLQVFASSRVDYSVETNLSILISKLFGQYFPAVLCFLLTDLAIIFRLLKNNVVSEYAQPYTLSARSKGLSRWQVFYKHVIPNSLIPIATLMIGSIPLFLAGSVIVEVVFNIPGMGRLLFNSINRADWEVVYAIVMLIAVLVVIFYLLGDVINKKLDPKLDLNEV